jgi:chaperonin GroES
MSLRPILDKIIIQEAEKEKETSGGIILATALDESIVEATVIAAGPGAYDDKGKFIKPEVEPGNRILFNAKSGQRFEHDEESYVTITNQEIVAVLS